MASNAAHKSTGWAAGVIAAAVVEQSVGPDGRHVWSALAFLMAFSGGTAPDWLEISWWSRGSGRHSWITHRTWTHWGLAWIAALVGAYLGMPEYPALALLFGFSAGGIMHLLADFPNPLGVPWILPTHRHSLKWWKSGRCDWFIIGAAWLGAAWIADHTWFGGHVSTWARGVFYADVWPYICGLVLQCASELTA
jgi:membrane-bound metal-dependent hydrolase YbcI (DUF457 family)